MLRKKFGENKNVIRKYFLVSVDGSLFDEFQKIAPCASDQTDLIEKFIRGLVDRVNQSVSGKQS
jgi:hypothetical protein